MRTLPQSRADLALPQPELSRQKTSSTLPPTCACSLARIWPESRKWPPATAVWHENNNSHLSGEVPTFELYRFSEKVQPSESRCLQITRRWRWLSWRRPSRPRFDLPTFWVWKSLLFILTNNNEKLCYACFKISSVENYPVLTSRACLPLGTRLTWLSVSRPVRQLQKMIYWTRCESFLICLLGVILTSQFKTQCYKTFIFSDWLHFRTIQWQRRQSNRLRRNWNRSRPPNWRGHRLQGQIFTTLYSFNF